MGRFRLSDRREVVKMPPRLHQATRQSVMKMSISGTSERKRARTVGTTQATGNKILQAFRNEGPVHDAARRLTRKPTDEEGAAIVAAASIAPSMTAG